MVREIYENEFGQLLELYLHLHEDSVPDFDEHLKNTWETIVNDPNHHIIVKVVEGRIVSSCVCVVIPNLTRKIRPYAFVENVVTHGDFRGKGYASQCLDFAKDGGDVLFSPAFSSFGMFNGYKERGKSFDDAVLYLKNSKIV